MANPDVRRATALIRDERALSLALAEHERHPFDAEAATVLRERVEDLLETVDTTLPDVAFWDVLAEQAADPLTPQQRDRLRCLDSAALGALLQLAGYAGVPGPPAQELVDETLASIQAALHARHDADAVRRARSYLSSLHDRLRVQLAELDAVPDLGASMLRDAARTLGGATRWLIPKTVGVAAEAVVQQHSVGGGSGLVAGTAVRRVARDGPAWATTSLVGWVRRSEPVPAQRPSVAGPDRFGVLDPLESHEAALDDQLQVLNGALRYPEADDVDQYRELLRRARRHLSRLEDLARDRDLDGGYRDHLRHLRRAVAEIDARLEPVP